MVRSPFGPPKYCKPNGAVVDRRVWVTSHVPANIGKGRYVLSIPALLKSADVVEDEEAAKAEDGEGNVKIASSSRRRAIVFLLLVLLSVTALTATTGTNDDEISPVAVAMVAVAVAPLTVRNDRRVLSVLSILLLLVVLLLLLLLLLAVVRHSVSEGIHTNHNNDTNHTIALLAQRTYTYATIRISIDELLFVIEERIVYSYMMLVVVTCCLARMVLF